MTYPFIALGLALIFLGYLLYLPFARKKGKPKSDFVWPGIFFIVVWIIIYYFFMR